MERFELFLSLIIIGFLAMFGETEGESSGVIIRRVKDKKRNGREQEIILIPRECGHPTIFKSESKRKGPGNVLILTGGGDCDKKNTVNYKPQFMPIPYLMPKSHNFLVPMHFHPHQRDNKFIHAPAHGGVPQHNPQHHFPQHNPQLNPQHHFPQLNPQHHFPQHNPQLNPQLNPQHHFPQHNPQLNPQHHFPQLNPQHHFPQHNPQHIPQNIPQNIPQHAPVQYESNNGEMDNEYVTSDHSMKENSLLQHSTHLNPIQGYVTEQKSLIDSSINEHSMGQQHMGHDPMSHHTMGGPYINQNTMDAYLISHDTDAQKQTNDHSKDQNSTGQKSKIPPYIKDQFLGIQYLDNKSRNQKKIRNKTLKNLTSNSSKLSSPYLMLKQNSIHVPTESSSYPSYSQLLSTT